MNFSVYIDPKIGEEMNQLAKLLGKSRNNLIKEAIERFLKDHRLKAWPQSIVKFKGVPDFKGFETYRSEPK